MQKQISLCIKRSKMLQRHIGADIYELRLLQGKNSWSMKYSEKKQIAKY